MQSKDLSGNETVLRGEGRISFDSLPSLRMTNPFVVWLFAIFGTLIPIVNYSAFHYKQRSTESIKKPPPFPAEVQKPVMGSIT